MTGPEPGWLIDPEDDTRMRYWDGQSWTEHRRDRDVSGDSAQHRPGVTSATAPSPGAHPSGADAPFPSVSPRSPASQRPSARLVWLLAAAVVIVAVVGVVVVMRGGGTSSAVCDAFATGDFSSADDLVQDLSGGDELKEEIEFDLGQLAADEHRRTSDLSTLFPPTITNEQDFVDDRTDAVDNVWAACADTAEFPRRGSSEYERVLDEAIDNARYRYQMDGP